MINRIKSLVRENRKYQRRIMMQTQELEWSQIYHDSIRGKKYLTDLQLNIGRWAGNYSFFYVLNRILMDYKPKSILEFGLGESSKLISTYLNHYLFDSTHVIIEQDRNWAKYFKERFVLSPRSRIELFPLKEIRIKDYKCNVYENFNQRLREIFDLYVIDGPFGSERYSRYDIVGQVKNFNQENEFIIIIDDYERTGEKDTIQDVVEELNSKNINFYTGTYSGNKTQLVIASKKYKFAASL